MSEINKIVKFTVIADQISEKVEVMELKKDDVIIVQLPENSTQEDINVFNETFQGVSNIKNEVLIMFDPIKVFGATLQEIEETRKLLQKIEEEMYSSVGVPKELLEGEKK